MENPILDIKQALSLRSLDKLEIVLADYQSALALAIEQREEEPSLTNRAQVRVLQLRVDLIVKRIKEIQARNQAKTRNMSAQTEIISKQMIKLVEIGFKAGTNFGKQSALMLTLNKHQNQSSAKTKTTSLDDWDTKEQEKLGDTFSQHVQQLMSEGKSLNEALDQIKAEERAKDQFDMSTLIGARSPEEQKEYAAKIQAEIDAEKAQMLTEGGGML